MQNTSLPKAVIFDMDGVLVSSEPILREAAITYLKDKGLSQIQDDDFKPFIGSGEEKYIGGVAEKYGLEIDATLAKKTVYEQYFKLIKGRLKPLPGVIDFIDKCKNMGKKIALASSADLIKVKANLSEIGIPLNRFDVTCTGDDAKNKKPDPEIFLLATKRLGFSPQECLVIEDAATGVKAAKSAGCRCLAVTTSLSREELKEADYIFDNLTEVDNEVLSW